MSRVGQIEIATQKRLLMLFEKELTLRIPRRLARARRNTAMLNRI